jgi:hypothetical protein
MKKMMNTILIAVASIGLLTACPSRNNDNATLPPPVVGPIGPIGPGQWAMQAPGGYISIFSGVGKSYGRIASTPSIELALEFFAPNTILNPVANSLQQYVGPVIPVGDLMVNADASSSTCQIPVGNYRVSTVNNQTINYGGRTLSGMNLVAQGPAQLTMALGNGQVNAASPVVVGSLPPIQGIPFQNWIYGDLYILTVNGISCNNITGWFTIGL